MRHSDVPTSEEPKELIKHFWKAMFLCAFCLVPSQTIAQSGGAYSVQDLLNNCVAEEDLVRQGLCVGMFQGLIPLMQVNCSLKSDGIEVPEHLTAGSPPTTGAAVQAFLNWARANPQYWSQPAVLGVLESVSDTFPCNR